MVGTATTSVSVLAVHCRAWADTRADLTALRVGPVTARDGPATARVGPR